MSVHFSDNELPEENNIHKGKGNRGMGTLLCTSWGHHIDGASKSEWHPHYLPVPGNLHETDPKEVFWSGMSQNASCKRKGHYITL